MAGHVHGATQGRMLWVSLALTVTFVAAECFFGIHGRSLALLSDAGHNASDALALGLAGYAVWVARRPADPAKTFGYHRVAILTAFVNAVVLVAIAMAIFAEAIHDFAHPPAPSGLTMIWVAAAALLMNTVIAGSLRQDSHHSLNSRAAYIHMAGDALSSIAVIFAGLIIKLTGWFLADPMVSVLIGVFILYSSWGIVGEAANILLEGSPKGLDIAALVESLRSVPPVLDVHDLHVWTIGDGIHFLSCHVVLPESTTMVETAVTIQALNAHLARDFAIGHATIQAETLNDGKCHVVSQGLYCALDPHAHTHTEQI